MQLFNDLISVMESTIQCGLIPVWNRGGGSHRPSMQNSQSLLGTEAGRDGRGKVKSSSVGPQSRATANKYNLPCISRATGKDSKCFTKKNNR